MTTDAMRIVDHDAELLRIESMLGSADDARSVMRRFLGTSGDVPDDDAADAYATLRSCVGRLLRSEAEYETLAGWHSVIKAVKARLRRPGAERREEIALETLAELVFERAGMARLAVEAPHLAPLAALIDAMGQEGEEGMTIRAISSRSGLSEEYVGRMAVAVADAGRVEVVRRKGVVRISLRRNA